MENYMQTQQNNGALAQAATGREMEEVKGMIFMAKTYPRDESVSLERILKSCERKSLAEVAMYEYPRGGQKVSGPSVRLAEVIAQNWMNIDFGVKELEQRGGESTVMAYAWDMETNVRQTKIFTQKHERKAGGRIDRLSDPRDIYELVANNGARRMRACILGIIPGDVIEAAVEKCKETMKKSFGTSDQLKEKIAKMIEMFADYKVTKEMLEKLIGCNSDAFTAKDLLRLGGIYNSIKDGMSKPNQYFEIDKPKIEQPSETKLDKELQNGTK
jgi:hypothetical protein